MIMPCMNSTSACDRGGSVPFVDGGSVLLGLPGAPGCTTTGVAGLACCASAGTEKRPAGALTASSVPHSTADPLAECSSRLRRKRQSFHFAFADCRSIRFDCGISDNPTLGDRYEVEPGPGGVGLILACPFSPALRLPIKRDRRPKSCADDHAGPQHRPKVWR